MVTAPIPPAPFSPKPPTHYPLPAQELMAGGPVAMMYRGLRERLEAAFPPAKFSHRILPARLTPEAWSRFTTDTPAIGLGFVELRAKKGALVRPRVWSGDAHWMVFLVCRNPEIAAQLLGDHLGPGMAGMMAVAIAALQGRNIGGIGCAEVGDAGPVYADAWANSQVAPAALSVTVPCELIDAAGLSRLDDFLRMGESWEGSGMPDLVVNIRDDGVAAG